MSRVLPMPASPSTSATEGGCVTASSRACSSPARPASTGASEGRGPAADEAGRGGGGERREHGHSGPVGAATRPCHRGTGCSTTVPACSLAQPTPLGKSGNRADLGVLRLPGRSPWTCRARDAPRTCPTRTPDTNATGTKRLGGRGGLSSPLPPAESGSTSHAAQRRATPSARAAVATAAVTAGATRSSNGEGMTLSALSSSVTTAASASAAASFMPSVIREART